MKQLITVLILVMIFCIKAYDPFEKANELYEKTEWAEAEKEYKRIFKAIESKEIGVDEIEKEALIRGHVNYADVLWALGVTDWDSNKHKDARDKWVLACEHWAYRLQGKSFGRMALGDEWDGSDLQEKTIVVFSERDSGAFGDTFIMSFLMRYLKDRGATVYFVSQAPLKSLYEVDDTIQKNYVDRVFKRGDQLPEHSAKIYLWSLLKDYLAKVEHPFPAKNWLSGPDDQCTFKNVLEKYTDTLLIGFWYRSSANVASDYCFRDRNLGAERILATLGDVSQVTLICLEGAGHFPINKEEYESREKLNNKGNLDLVDVTSCKKSSIIIFPENFDQKRGAFVDTFSIMHYIKQKGGLLIGCDTGLLNAAAGTKKADEDKQPSVFAILNAQADFRWGSRKEIQDDGSVKPRTFYLSHDVQIYQAPKQGDFDTPLKQIKEVVKNRALDYQKKIKSSAKI